MSTSRPKDFRSPGLGDREGFEKLMNRGDATIDIPLQDRNGDLHPNRGTPADEKGGYFPRRGMRKSLALQQKEKLQTGYDGEANRELKMGQIYKKILNFSVFTRYFLYIIPVGLLIAIPIIVGATSAHESYIGGVRMLWVFTWILCSWCGLWGSKVVAHYLPFVFQTLCGVVSPGTRKYSLILRSLEIPLSLVGWALVTLATFKPLMTRNPESRAKEASKEGWPTPDWINIVQQILAAFMASSLIFAGERLFIQIVTINYHRKQFHARITESKRQMHLLGLLFNASRGMFPMFCPEFVEEDAIIEDTLDLTFGAKKKKKYGHSRSGSSTPAKMLQDLGNIGDQVKAALGSVAKEVTGKQVLANPHSAQTIVNKALEKNRSSEALARRLWLSFVIEGNDALYMDDMVEVLGPEHGLEAEECFSMLDRDGNGDISLDEMILTISQFGRDRHSIATSMHDVDQAIKVLDRMLCTVIFIIVVFIFVAFLNHSFVTTLATAGTALLSLSFVFSATAAEFLGSCIFLFVKQPYDIGDRVELNTGTDQMIVEHISLLFTVFRRIDSHRMVQIPHIILNTLWIENVSRSNAMKERLSLFVSFDTTLEDVQSLRAEMKNFVLAPENKRDFQDDITIEVVGIGTMDQLELSIEILHKSNWSNETVRAARRSKFMCALVLAIRKVPIYGPGGGAAGLGTSDNPSYSVAVSDAQAQGFRTKAAEDKESKRLVPTNNGNVEKLADSLGSPNELRMMTSLNDRDPAVDASRDAGGFRGGSAMSPTSPRLGLGEQPLTVQTGGLLRRETTKGRRKSNKTNDSTTDPGTGLGMSQSVASSTAVDTMNSRSGPAVPQIGITGTTGYPLGRENSGISEESEWYGEERLDTRQVENFPPPPQPGQYNPGAQNQREPRAPSYKPSNPQMGTWRGT